jgi:hypothetical protein
MPHFSEEKLFIFQKKNSLIFLYAKFLRENKGRNRFDLKINVNQLFIYRQLQTHFQKPYSLHLIVIHLNFSNPNKEIYHE